VGGRVSALVGGRVSECAGTSERRLVGAHRCWRAGVRAAGDQSWRPGDASVDASGRRTSGGGRVAAAGCVSQKE
jgi:hypothetical protein